MNKYKKAFTLIELSIVLIIIGLIIGGIVAGQELINQVKVRGLIKDVNNIQLAIDAFKLKYSYLPGDFPNAGQTLGCTDALWPTGCNGNWQIEAQDSGNANAWPGDEILRFWQHLSLANMIAGKYTGSNSPKNIFQSIYSSSALIGARYISPFSSSISYNTLQIASWSSAWTNNVEGVMAPVDAYGFDSKTDDGLANSGKVFGVDGHSSNLGKCSYDIGGSSVQNYNINNSGLDCRLFITID